VIEVVYGSEGDFVDQSSRHAIFDGPIRLCVCALMLT
jgi:hypothetical protein